jgi:hypothetical protein
VKQVLEQKQGGRWFSRHEDGSEVNVGYVLNGVPHAKLILVWQIAGNFQCVPKLITKWN